MQHLKSALAAGRIGPSQYEAIRTGLGDPPLQRYPGLDPEFLPDAWANAVAILIDEARRIPIEELRAAARVARDRMDPTGVGLRFEERFESRSFRLWIDEHGRHHARMIFDDEAAAWVQSILRAAMRPRRGPRFVSDGSSPDAAPAGDDRTNEQLQYDTLIAVLRTGAAADPAQAFGDRQPGVRIIVEAAAITGAAGRGGQRVTGIAITARDGGCMWPSCIAPPSECEYHHIDHWWAEHGRTDVDDGVPLCRNCHLRLHNSGWRITRERDSVTGKDTYLLHAPPDSATGIVPEPVALSSKAPRRFAAA